MPTIKTDNQVSERLLNIDWGKPDSGRLTPQRDLRGATVAVRIDEVFHHINAYRALVESDAAPEGLLARSLIAQANAIFNQAFVNLEQRHGFAKVFVDPPTGATGLEDITDLVIAEVKTMQNILDA
ncbi:MAG: hypothetical protein KF696_05475 [Planctomycetes bacterium]|nr:hypothetical protein [Planctomycetota bacterium]MCW8136337.1 hypothetical protein [Planctomycetota bacterium]